MEFINEFIPADDVLKYGIEAINKDYGKFTYKPHWTVDRERDIYLREVATGREEFANQSSWTFYWKGSLLRLVTTGAVGELPTGERFLSYSLGRIEIPEELLGQREEILADLKDAFIARNSDGVHTTRPFSKSTFNF